MRLRSHAFCFRSNSIDDSGGQLGRRDPAVQRGGLFASKLLQASPAPQHMPEQKTHCIGRQLIATESVETILEAPAGAFANRNDFAVH
jgi:hypothetical protein